MACAHAGHPPASPLPALSESSVRLTLTVPVETDLGVQGVPDTRAVWIELLQGARSSIDLEQFYISEQSGEALTGVLTALTSAAARGVRVRIVVDHHFFQTYPDTVRSLDALANVEARVVDYAPRGGIQHAKFFVVDGERSYLGSANFDWRALSHIHEVGLAIRSSGIAQGLETVFARDWSDAVEVDAAGDRVASPGAAPAGTTDPAVTLLASPPATTPEGVADTLHALTALIDGARHSLAVQVYEYALHGYGTDTTPWTVLDDALRRAAARGVAVRLMVDATALQRGGPALYALAGIHGITVRTVTIPRWSGGDIPFARLVHSKYMVVDGTVGWVGTENWSPGYFTNCRNVGVLLRDSASIGTLNAIYERLWASPYATTLTPASP